MKQDPQTPWFMTGEALHDQSIVIDYGTVYPPDIVEIVYDFAWVEERDTFYWESFWEEDKEDFLDFEVERS